MIDWQRVRLVSGMVLTTFCVLAVAIAGPVGIPVVLIFGPIAGFLLSPWIAEPVVRLCTGFTYSGKAADPPEQFTRVKALIAQHQYAEAESELRTLLEPRPDLLEGQWLLASLLYENRHQPEPALAVITAALQGTWFPGSEKLALLGVDILLELERRDEAVALLRDSASRAGATPAAARLTERLHHLTADAG